MPAKQNFIKGVNRMTRIVFEQISKVRDSGETNMFDVPAVIRTAYDNDWYELVTWLSDESNHKEYTRLIFTGVPELED